MQTKNINIKFPQAKAGAEERLRFYPTMHFFNCDSLVFGSNAELEIFLEEGGGLNFLPIVVNSGVSE